MSSSTAATAVRLDSPIGLDRATQVGQLLAQLAALIATERPSTPEPNPQPMPGRVLFTVEEAAQQLGVGKTTTYAFVRSGELESVRIGRLRRIHADSIARFAARLVSENHAA